ncbi:Zinc finger, C3HC4 type (RING finger) family protein [Cryptosporidium meleagridis]|uniref:Zinc finger, C3HC4 type (RING finger) family protein n=1 Tax=Cryptosporidium meleagridis TaxID=93969 RepID=A0A2P4Z3Y7_9CRYT|nr:Zinc finger, C3HC4 type (RING finger) family protein [Cryptosporidium meleagridis]
MANSKIYYKFKSEKKFKDLTHEFPALVSHVRSKLREILDIGEDMDILATQSDKNGRVSNVYLSDYEILKEGVYLNVVRLPKDLAKPLLEAANSKIKNKPSTLLQATNSATSGTAPSNISSVREQIALSPPSTIDVASNGDDFTKFGERKDDDHNSVLNSTNPSNNSNNNSSEDAAILSVMRQHGEKFKQTAAQRSEMLEQFNQRGYPKSVTATGSRNGAGNTVGTNFSASNQFRSEPYKKPGAIGTGPLNTGSSNNYFAGQSYNASFGPSSASVNYNYKNAMTNASTDVPADYICHMCGERGHHIRVCPKVNEGVSQKKIRPATGIPRSFLRAINFDEEGRLYSEVYCLPDGTFAVLKDAKQLSSTAFLTRTVEDTIGKHMGKSKEDTSLVRDSLTCPICARLFRYAVLTPCCGETYCQECIINFIRNHMDAASGISPNTIKGYCPHCSTVISIADLEPNNPIRKSVNVALGLQPI